MSYDTQKFCVLFTMGVLIVLVTMEMWNWITTNLDSHRSILIVSLVAFGVVYYLFEWRYNRGEDW
jgi:hypothetical protein